MLLLLLCLLAAAVFEAPRLIYNKMWRELAVFLLLWLFASTMAVIQFLKLEFPTVTEILQKLFAGLK
ncbi:MAG TPA: hypothetical protein DCE00_03620 [Firmicutes bacterium]|nr:hypothetical protein [Bacillota bacterium]HAA37944.1 hypothetical protein [Bacillota bacterium]